MLASAGVKLLVNGPIPVSADGEPLMGLAPEYDNVFVAAGFQGYQACHATAVLLDDYAMAAGIGAGGGAGLMMAEWILHGRYARTRRLSALLSAALLYGCIAAGRVWICGRWTCGDSARCTTRGSSSKRAPVCPDLITSNISPCLLALSQLMSTATIIVSTGRETRE